MASFKTKDNVKKSELFIGNTPEESLQIAKQQNIGCKYFRVGKIAYNTLGEKLKTA